jgi:hypothetical protein
MITVIGSVSANVYTINNSTGAIQNTVSTMGDGDILILNPGIYWENDISFSSSITIEANTTAGGNPTNTIIDGLGGLNGIFTNNGASKSFTIDNLTLRNGNASTSYYGGAITSMNGGSVLIVTSSIIVNCSAMTGGAIATHDGDVTIVSSAILNCTAQYQSGAIDTNNGNVTVTSSSIISNCSAGNGNGGAIDSGGTGSVIITSSTIFNSIALSGNGGAIRTYEGNVTVTSSTISNCSTYNGEGGAIASDGSGSVMINVSTISNCSANNDGGAIYSGGTGTITVTSSTISNCQSGSGVGGAIYSQGSVTVDSSTITDCSANVDGGGIYAGEGLVTVTSSTISNCSTTGDGGAVFAQSGTISFSRLVNDNTGGVTAVYALATIDATDNWWGTNSPSSSLVNSYYTSYVTYSPWLVLGITAIPSSITTSGTSTIQANLTYNSTGSASTLGIVPDGIPVAFALTGVSGNLVPWAGNMSAGVNSTKLTPFSAGTATVTATVDGQTTSTQINVLLSPPSVTGISPSSGPLSGGSTVTITGSGFTGATSVSFGGTVNATGAMTVNSDTSITVTAPSHLAGTVDVTVTTASGTSTTSSADTFTYVIPPPTASGIMPASGVNTTTVSITNLAGTNFASGATVMLTPSNSNPVHKGSIVDATGTGGALLNYPNSVYVSGNYAYVASANSNALEIVDVSDPANPVHKGNISTGAGGALLNKPWSVYVSGNYAYVTSRESNALEIVDVTNPASPVHKGCITDNSISGSGALLNDPDSVYVSGNYAYVASVGSNALEIVDVTNPASPVHKGSIVDATGTGGALLNDPHSVYVSGNYAYVASYDSNALEIVDVTNPANPVHKGSIVDATGTGGALLNGPQSVYVSGNYAYVASANSDALEIVDVSNPANPVHKGSIVNGAGGALLHWPESVYVSGNYAYVASWGSNALEIVDVTNPANPVHKGSIVNGAGGALLSDPAGVYVSGNYEYVGSAGSNALEIVDVGTVTGTSVAWLSSTQMTCTFDLTNKIAGLYNVVVTNPDGSFGTLANGFTVTSVSAPTISGISPSSGPLSGGSTVTITGTNLANPTAVKFGSTSATILTSSSTTITVTPPTGSVGTVDITVTTAGGTSSTSSADHYTYGTNIITISNSSGAIQGSISSVADGGTLILNPGIYWENDITFSQNITIEANATAGGNPTNTIIDGLGGLNGIFTNNGAAKSFTIDNLTLRNGNASTSSYGGAITSMNGGSVVNVTSSIIINCSAQTGGAIATHDGDVTIASSSILNCTAQYQSGAIDTNNGNVTVTSSVISNCSAGSGNGGAIDSGGEGSIIITSSTFFNCITLSGNGGAIRTWNGPVTVNSSTISNCSAFYSGGAIQTGNNVTVTSSTISNCSAGNGGGGGGAIAAGTNSIVTVTSSTISNCSAGSNGGGGAIHMLYSNGELEVISSTITGCTAYTGGAIAADTNGAVTVISSTISNCSAVGVYGGGGAINAANGPVTVTAANITGCQTNVWGGAIWINGDGQVTVTSSTISNCSADTGGGGAINTSDGPVTVTLSTISNCSAGDRGGAIYTGNNNVTVTSSTISGCTSSLSGGAIKADSTGSITLTSSTITNCSGNEGGAISANNGNVTVISSTISNCSASSFGGGAIVSYGSATVTSSTIFNCTAHGDGGGIDVGNNEGTGTSGSATVTSSTISNCTATNGNGGGIEIEGTSGSATVTSSTIANCAAGLLAGGAVSAPSGTISFSRLVNNTNGGGTTINATSSITAKNNWWGSNNPSSALVSNGVSYNPWLVLGVIATPSSVSVGGTSTIRANLTYDSAGADTSGLGHVPDGIPITFALTGGSGTLTPLAGNISAGVNTTICSLTSAGIATITANVDGQSVSAVVSVAGASSTGTSGSGTAPIANFTATPTSGTVPLIVQFTDTSTTSAGSINNWSWNFGDGNTSIQENPVNTFSWPQVFNITLTVTGSTGLTNSTMQQITVFAPPTIFSTQVNGTTATTVSGIQSLQVSNQTIENTNGNVTSTATTLTVQNASTFWQSAQVFAQSVSYDTTTSNYDVQNVNQVILQSTPVTANLSQTIGNVSVSLNIALNQYVSNAAVNVAITQGANTSTMQGFQLAATNANINVKSVAYTVELTNTDPINTNLINQTTNATQAPHAVVIKMNVNHDWVAQFDNGANNYGRGAIDIIRYPATGNPQVLTTRFDYYDPSTNLDWFEADSPNGLSIFGLVEYAAQQAATANSHGSQVVTAAPTKIAAAPPTAAVTPLPSQTAMPVATPTPAPLATVAPALAPTQPPAPRIIVQNQAKLTTDKAGRLTEAIGVQSADKTALLTLPQNLKATDAAGQTLSEVSIQPLASNLVPPTEAGSAATLCGPVYMCGPDGAQFTPAIALTITLTEDQWTTLNANGREPVIRAYTPATGSWQTLTTVSDASTYTLTASVPHFTDFAVFTQPVPQTSPATPLSAPTDPYDIMLSMLVWTLGAFRQNLVIAAVCVGMVCAVPITWWWYRRKKQYDIIFGKR